MFRGGVDFLSSCNQTPDVTLAETTGVARLGFSVLLTDLGGDGLADLVAGGPSWKSSRGVVRVDATDGSLGPWAGDAAGDKAGWSLSTIELDGAAGDELLIGAPFASAVDASGLALSHVGRAYALEAWAVSGLLGAVAMGGVYGEAPNDMLGYALSATGNLASVYGSSLIVGAPGGDRNGLTDNGVGYIFDGSTIVANGASGVSAADGGAIAASTSKARLGAALSGLGDVNGVVYDDAIAGAPGANGVGEVVLGGQ